MDTGETAAETIYRENQFKDYENISINQSKSNYANSLQSYQSDLYNSQAENDY